MFAAWPMRSRGMGSRTPGTFTSTSTTHGKASGTLWRTTDDIRDAWDSMTRIGFSQSGLAPYARPGHWNDPDMLEIGNGGMNENEYRAHMSLWSILAAPLLAGNDLRNVPAG